MAKVPKKYGVAEKVLKILKRARICAVTAEIFGKLYSELQVKINFFMHIGVSALAIKNVRKSQLQESCKNYRTEFCMNFFYDFIC